jgi:PIN domain nuclease of toxin-antitoxin system
MGIVLDAFALVAFFAGEPAAPDVRRILSSGDAAISTVNLAEASQHLIRRGAATADELKQLVGSIPLVVVPFMEAHAWRASDLRAQYYRRADSAVSLADCCLVAVATTADRIATADAAVIRMAAAEGIGALELPQP